MAELNKAHVLSQINDGIEGVRAWARRAGVDVLIWDVEHVDISTTPGPRSIKAAGDPAEENENDDRANDEKENQDDKRRDDRGHVSRGT